MSKLNLTCLVTPRANASIAEILELFYGDGAKIVGQTTVRDCIVDGSVASIAHVGDSIVLFDPGMANTVFEHELDWNVLGGIFTSILHGKFHNDGCSNILAVAGGRERRRFGVGPWGVSGDGEILPIERKIVERVARELGQPPLAQEWFVDSCTNTKIEGDRERQARRAQLIELFVPAFISELVGKPILGEDSLNGSANLLAIEE